MVQPDGCVLPPGGKRFSADADLFPGLTLFSLATYGTAIGDDLGLDWPTIRSWYMRRARLVRPWGLMAWQAQVWNLVGTLTGDADHQHGQRRACANRCWRANLTPVDGSFLTDMGTSGPGFHTAFVAEGMVAGKWSALALGNEEKVKRFQDSLGTRPWPSATSSSSGVRTPTGRRSPPSCWAGSGRPP